jgi:hypothetical protein
MIPLNSAPPSYIKQVTAYKEGSDGLFIYIILADNTGAMTTASGTLALEIIGTHHDFSLYSRMVKQDLTLYSTSIPISNSSFRRTKVGRGAFEHEVIMFPIGRIVYSSFIMRPSNMTGKVKVTFVTKDDRVLEGEETIFF